MELYHKNVCLGKNTDYLRFMAIHGVRHPLGVLGYTVMGRGDT